MMQFLAIKLAIDKKFLHAIAPSVFLIAWFLSIFDAFFKLPLFVFI